MAAEFTTSGQSWPCCLLIYSCSAGGFAEWGKTFEEAVMAVIAKRDKEREEAKAKYLRENMKTPEECAAMIKKGQFPFPGLNQF